MKKALFITLLFVPYFLASQMVSINVLKVKQVPFVTQFGGNSSSSTCRVTGATLNTLDLDCETQQNQGASVPGVSYAMLATASDGNTYIFGCSAQWRWSKCADLNPGSFDARVDGGRLIVRATNAKGKSVDVAYSIFSIETSPHD